MTKELILQDERALPALEMAQRYSVADILPETFRKKPENCLIAINFARRIGIEPFTVMQNMHIVRNRPALSAQFAISLVNTCGRFSPLRWKYFGTPGAADRGCIAYATQLDTGEVLEGTAVTLKMAKEEAWGSKWKTMPDQMLAYRSASFWARLYAPELMNGLQTIEEAEEVEYREVRPASIPGMDIALPKPNPAPIASTTEKLRDKFAELGITEATICARYEVEGLEGLTEENISELRKTYLDLSSKKKTLSADDFATAVQNAFAPLDETESDYVEIIEE